MIRWPATELDPTTFPAWREAIARFDGAGPPDHTPRSYPGYPRIALPHPKRRWRSSLERALATRRHHRALARTQPTAAELGRLCALAHGITGESARGPVPSAGGLQALELYCGVAETGWLARGWYHYDRREHALAQLGDSHAIDLELIPSCITIDGGALMFAIVGDGARVAAKYGERGLRFLLLEAGALVQNLALASVDIGLTTIPLGGFFERPLASALQLPSTDEVLCVAVCGRPTP